MALTINTNVVSINAQRNLNLSGSQLGVSMQRLSSGLRVNSAKDDAAGLAIAERMNAQARGLSVASRNANDGISLAQTAEGALGKVGDMLQRMRELAVQASNATNSDTDRVALNAEVQQMVAEIDRVAKTTSFNGKKILDGSFAGGVFQVGAGAGDNITVAGIADSRADKIAKVNYNKVEVTLNPTDWDEALLNQADLDAAVVAAQAAWQDDQDNNSGGNATALQQDIDDATAAAAAGPLSIQVGSGDVIELQSIPAASSATERMGQVVAAINAKTADTGVTAFLEGSKMILLSEKLDSTGTPEAVTFTANEPLKTGFNDATWTWNAVAATDQAGIHNISVKTQAGAWDALKRIDSALDQVNSARATLGALQTRFEKSIENIDIMNENISAARGRIVDADFASETASLSRTQILQQAGVAMVSQANQIPQNVLSLLQ